MYYLYWNDWTDNETRSNSKYSADIGSAIRRFYESFGYESVEVDASAPYIEGDGQLKSWVELTLDEDYTTEFSVTIVED
jgi:hypothetical protein